MVVPVSNAGKALAADVQHMCEVLSELTDWFEVLLVDEGASDHAVDTAHELAVEFPQVRIVRMRAQPIRTSVLHTALKQAQGQVVFIQEGHGPCLTSHIRRLWDQAGDDEPGELADAAAGAPRRVHIAR